MKTMKLFAILLSAGLALGLSTGAVASEGKTLAEIHGATWPKSVDGFVTKNQCLQCHGPYEKLAKSTENLSPNPHSSHLGAVNCEDCHKANKSEPEIMCNQCHQFNFSKKTAK